VNFRRVAIDVAMENALGRFYAAKLRSGVLWAIYEKTGDATARTEALKAYKKARAAWAEVANQAKGIYVDDVTFASIINCEVIGSIACPRSIKISRRWKRGPNAPFSQEIRRQDAAPSRKLYRPSGVHLCDVSIARGAFPPLGKRIQSRLP